jgi:hypothetical protein
MYSVLIAVKQLIPAAGDQIVQSVWGFRWITGRLFTDNRSSTITRAVECGLKNLESRLARAARKLEVSIPAFA